MKNWTWVVAALLVVGCGAEEEPSIGDEAQVVQMSLKGGKSAEKKKKDKGEQPEPEPEPPTEEELGQHLFENEIFDGNGRTCSSCHTEGLRALSPADAQALFADNPNDPLFQHDAADNFGGSSPTEVCVAVAPDLACKYTTRVRDPYVRCEVRPDLGVTFECETSFKRVLTDATIRVGINPHPNVTVNGVNRPVIVNRGVPTTLDTPALDAVLMSDGRAPTLQAQAADALAGHAQASEFDSIDLDRIAAFERSEFSSATLANYAAGGPAPVLPPGNTASEIRGRTFFTQPVAVEKAGFCGLCHNGPMLNEVGLEFDFGAANDEIPAFQAVPGDRFSTAFVSEVNTAQNPNYLWTFNDGAGNIRTIVSPDVGQGAITGVWSDVHRFKIPSLWGSSQTAPYFHDNSAKTIEELVDHYANFVAPPFGVVLDLQDRADIVAYMKLL